MCIRDRYRGCNPSVTVFFLLGGEILWAWRANTYLGQNSVTVHNILREPRWPDPAHRDAFQFARRVVVLGVKSAARSLLCGRTTLLSSTSRFVLCEVSKRDGAQVHANRISSSNTPRPAKKEASPVSYHPWEEPRGAVSRLDACRQRGVRRRSLSLIHISEPTRPY